MLTHMHLIRYTLRKRFPEAKIALDPDVADIWHVRYYDGDMEYTDTYRVTELGEKLQLISTMEVEL